MSRILDIISEMVTDRNASIKFILEVYFNDIDKDLIHEVNPIIKLNPEQGIQEFSIAIESEKLKDLLEKIESEKSQSSYNDYMVYKSDKDILLETIQTPIGTITLGKELNYSLSNTFFKQIQITVDQFNQDLRENNQLFLDNDSMIFI